MLIAINFSEITGSRLHIPRALITGVAFDVVTALYLAVPFAFFLLFVPKKWLGSRLGRGIFYSVFFLHIFALCYISVAEMFFFEEFNSRFNYVAVDYLVAPTEVFVNIWDTYPVWQALLVIAVISALLFRVMQPHLRGSLAAPAPWKQRGIFAAVYSVAIVLGASVLNINAAQISDNRALNEIAENGIYSFAHAALTNEMGYDEFYAHTADSQALPRLKGLIDTGNASLVYPDELYSIERDVRSEGTPKRMNVVLVLEESLGSKYVGSLHPEGPAVTPELDKLAADSLFFTHIYATGNRTVRAMEATLASFPPIPGQS
ncbi:MAG: LTA synthase family protein, partial [Burkholderiales bacterium]